MKVAVIGSRNIKNLNLQTLVEKIPAECTQIISGGATGVDTLAKEYAYTFGIDYVEFLPNYKVFGRQAPLVRNTQIVKAADHVLAFWNSRSRGTAHTIRQCIALGVPVRIYTID